MPLMCDASHTINTLLTFSNILALFFSGQLCTSCSNEPPVKGSSFQTFQSFGPILDPLMFLNALPGAGDAGFLSLDAVHLFIMKLIGSWADRSI